MISSRDVTEYLDMNQAVMIVALKAGNERNYTALQVLSAVLGAARLQNSSKTFASALPFAITRAHSLTGFRILFSYTAE